MSAKNGKKPHTPDETNFERFCRKRAECMQRLLCERKHKQDATVGFPSLSQYFPREK